MARRCALVCCLTLLPILAGAEIRVVGSDLLGDKLAQALSEFARDNERAISVAFTGSLTGWRDVQADRADIGLLSFPPGETIPDAPFYAAPIAYHAVMVLVPSQLVIGQISFVQLVGVFGNEEGSAWQRWSDLGLIGDQGARSVMPHALVADSGFSLELFRFEVLRSRSLRTGLKLDQSGEELMASLRTGESGIALSSHLPPEGSGIKVLAVSREPNGVAFLPTPATLFRGDYPLKWPVYVVFRRAKVSQLYPVLRFLLGEESAKLMAAARMLPVPVAARQDLLFGLEQLEK